MKNIITQFSRIFVGVLFIISGLIKANDPLGFGYKLSEYFEVFGTQFLIPFAPYLAMAICVLEILLAVWLLVGYKTKLTLYSLLGLIIFFTFLTFYSAYFNKVTDCGCFGDALHLKPWQSFQKDIILLVFILILFWGRDKLQPILTQNFRVFMAYGSLIATGIFTYYCFHYLPVKDFRPYAIGKDWQEQMKVPVGAPTDSFVMSFTYEKDGKQFQFSMDTLMKIKDLATYKFVSTESKKVREGVQPPIHDFSISTQEGNKVTDSFLSQKGYRILIVQYDLKKSDTKNQTKLNELVSKLMKKNKSVAIWALTASSSIDIGQYILDNQVPYNFYTGDGTMLKTIIRSNPGVVVMKDNTPVAMYPSTSLPDYERLNLLFLE